MHSVPFTGADSDICWGCAFVAYIVVQQVGLLVELLVLLEDLLRVSL